MAIIITRSKQLAAADTDGIAASQTPSGAGDLDLDGDLVVNGVAVLDTQRQVLLTFAADETGHNFVVYGTNQSGAAVQETVPGSSDPTAVTKNNFKTVTRVSIDAAAAGAIEVGTNGVGSTNWQSVDLFTEPVNIGFSVAVTGTVNYTVEYTLDNVQDLSIIPTVFAHGTVASKTDNQAGTFVTPVSYFRLTVNSGDGEAVLTYAQAGP